jgi:tRNA(Ile)-lysidine synthase
MKIFERVSETINQYALLSPGERIMAGVSGGADSLCLMICLRELGYQVVVGHLDHQLRAESADEAQFVEALAREAGLEVLIEKGDVRALIEQGYSIEEAARLVRYRFLARSAKKAGCTTIATGHTADDQIETILMHFLRGAGPSGLAGMAPKTQLDTWAGIPGAESLYLVRPLLTLRRDETEAFCRAMGLSPTLDQSNLDLSFYRNRIRHHLIPLLRDYNPAIDRIVLRMAKVMAGEAEMIAWMIDEYWDKVVVYEERDIIVISRPALLALPEGLRRAFLRAAIAALSPGIRDVGFEQVERALTFLQDENTAGKVPLLKRLGLSKSYDFIIVQRQGKKTILPQYPQIQGDVQIDIDFPCTIDLENGWKFIAEMQDAPPERHPLILARLHSHLAAVDASTLKGKAKLRTFRSGDRIQPLGMDGRVKVSELFINARIPFAARGNWPLLIDGDRIIWVVGLRIAHPNRITSKTNRIAIFEIRPT